MINVFITAGITVLSYVIAYDAYQRYNRRIERLKAERDKMRNELRVSLIELDRKSGFLSERIVTPQGITPLRGEAMYSHPVVVCYKGQNMFKMYGLANKENVYVKAVDIYRHTLQFDPEKKRPVKGVIKIKSLRL